MVTSTSKIRLLTYHHIPNNGAFLFAHSLLNLLQKEFPSADIETLDYRTRRLAAYEFMKRFKPLKGIPRFYDIRARLWNREMQGHLPLDTNLPHWANIKSLQQFFAREYTAVVTGMDVWCIIKGTQRPALPNIYWLPEKTSLLKIAYSVSAYHSNPQLISQVADQISNNLDGFEIIGARDHFTFDMVHKYRQRKSGLVDLIPDPTFTYELKHTGVVDKLASLGVDLTQPMLGLLFYGDDRLSNEIQAHYHAKGYQILALGMYNPAADFNLGHLLTPFEWADAFRLLNFCISDRFHGTVFCLKNNTPVICLEKEQYLPSQQSKIFDLLSSFGLQHCYHNPADTDFNSARFLSLADELEKAWQTYFAPDISENIARKQQLLADFTQKIKTHM